MKKASIFWFTGLSGAGKTTVAEGVRDALEKHKLQVMILDGDDVRSRTHRHLGFSEVDIKENNRLIVGLCQENRQEHDVILVPIISPYRKSRQEARGGLEPGFYEIYFSASLDCVRARDTKGLYQKAMENQIQNLIGVSKSNPYEPPVEADFIVNTAAEEPAKSIEKLAEFIGSKIAQKSTLEVLR